MKQILQSKSGNQFATDTFAAHVLTGAIPMYIVYKNNISVAYIYAADESIRFTDDQVSYTIAELQELKQLATSIHRQWAKQNA